MGHRLQSHTHTGAFCRLKDAIPLDQLAAVRVLHDEQHQVVPVDRGPETDIPLSLRIPAGFQSILQQVLQYHAHIHLRHRQFWGQIQLAEEGNIILAAQVLRGFFKPFSKAEANKFADEYIKLLEVKTASADTPIKSLSGGNQQKVILGRWLLTHPEYLILDEPTRGIDIGTKIEIQKLVLKLASEGMSVTFISSETDEMLRTCSRLVVMRDRKVVGELSGTDLTQAKVMETIAGGEM